jgi:hypothetical protein
MSDEEKVIFDLTRLDHKYKGVLFAEVDLSQVDKAMNCPFRAPKDYVAGIMALIWEDENGIWKSKTRIKYPSGNKQVFSLEYAKEHAEGIKVNETFILHSLYKFPMINKKWYPNPKETPEGIIELMRDADMIESIKIIQR